MVDSKNDDYKQMSVLDAFHALEKKVAGYNDFEDCTEESFKKTMEGFEDLVKRVQAESIFSKNETIKDIDTHYLKMLMVPSMEADVLFRLMDDREERVRQSHVYYLEYLKLMKHYDLLEEHQKKKFKDFQKRYQAMLKGQEMPDDGKPKDPVSLYMNASEDRDTKIANYKQKKLLESNLDRLRDYQDEEMRRELFITQIKLTIMAALDQLGMTEMEINVLKHRNQLTQEQHAENQKRSMKPENPQKMNAQYFGPDDVDQIPLLFQQNAVQLPDPNSDAIQFGLCPKHQEEEYREMQMRKYGDPRGGLSKKVERVVVQHDDVNDRMNLKTQYKDQVFQPFFELPTMTLEEFADMEVEDALERQQKQEEFEKMKEEEDSDDEAVLEEQRAKDTRMDDWKDWNPKGKGITHRI